MINQVREAGRAATAVTAIFDRLCADQTNVRTLITASQSAPGTLAAMQAQAQLTAVLSDQQASLQQIAATTSRAQVGFIMREVTAEEHAQWNAQQFMQGFGDVSFRGPHEGQGFTLPR
jgi:P-type conjugative transfer protein TrbJ